MSEGTQRVRGKGHTTGVSVTRPADTTAYAPGDVVGTAVTGTLIIPNASFGEFDAGIIQQAVVVSSAAVATSPDLELWLFDSTVAAIADNAAWAPTDAEMLTLVGIVEFPTADWKIGNATAGAGGNAVCVADNVSLPFNTKKGTSKLYGVLVVRNAYVPVSGEIFTLRLQVID
jgi:hypothetical protein